MIRFIYQLIIGMVFHKSVYCSNILECVRFVSLMKRCVQRIEKVQIVDTANSQRWPADGFLCVDYGIIFSASHRIGRYIIVQGGEKWVLEDTDIVIPCILNSADL